MSHCSSNFKTASLRIARRPQCSPSDPHHRTKALWLITQAPRCMQSSSDWWRGHTRFTQTNTQIDAWTVTHAHYKSHGFDLLLHFWFKSPLFIKQVDAEVEVELELLLFARVGCWSGVMIVFSCVVLFVESGRCLEYQHDEHKLGYTFSLWALKKTWILQLAFKFFFWSDPDSEQVFAYLNTVIKFTDKPLTVFKKGTNKTVELTAGWLLLKCAATYYLLQYTKIQYLWAVQ